AAPDPYSPSAETECSVEVPSVVEPGDRVVIRVSVASNTPTPPTGEIDVEILAVPGGKSLFSKTVAYSGGVKRIVGPALPDDEKYEVTTRFRPSDDSFLRCRVNALFAVDNATDNNGPDDNDNGPDGLLPDTGGPAMLWLLLGVGLVGGGAGAVVYSRRRSAAVPA
ncbi:LPXTG cell wall anchor domain-containing protein, partial [Nocardioides stalactiti]|uniref:LPXTG cell wall anchor domain-containing protein n=1 Tax=Nocardioides stalactiti TaxID=2755356 RepID=UPI00160078AB